MYSSYSVRHMFRLAVAFVKYFEVEIVWGYSGRNLVLPLP